MVQRDWQTSIGRKWFAEPGQHGLWIGMTGSGKTTKLFWSVQGIRHCNQNETIAWLDTGKSSESATLMTMGPVRYIIPRGCKIDIKMKDLPEGVKTYEHEVVEFTSPADCWQLLRKGWINVICLKPYIIDPPTYAICVAELFTKLIRLAHKYQIIKPLTVVVDELQVVCPAPKAGASSLVNEAAAMIELNIELLRSFGIRILAATQGNEKVRRGVRTEFQWLGACMGCNFYRHDEPRLYRFNDRFHRLQPNEFIVIFPERYFSDVITIPYYPKGEWIADIRYDGEFLIERRKKNKERAEEASA